MTARSTTAGTIARATLLLAAIAWPQSPATSQHTAKRQETARTERPRLERLPKQVAAPKDNPTTKAKVSLGKQLFFDPRLSGDNKRSCASCHLPEKALGDALSRAKGAGGKELSRNTPTLWNVAFQSSLHWDGRAKSLEEQARLPIQSPDEMNQDIDALVEELSAIEGYAQQFANVFGRPVDKQDIARALAAFQRTLIRRDAPFDRYLAGQKDALSPLARRGLELFTGEAGCIRCHHGPLLSDGKFYRLGVGLDGPVRDDKGRGAITGKRQDDYKFRTPSLREVADTGPYMHDGSEKSLASVVEFYFRRAPLRGPDGLKLDIQPLTAQSYSDIDALVAFLKSLSGTGPEITPPELP